MKTITSIREIQNVPAIYALYGGRGPNEYVAYVGVADKLRQRIQQHLVKHDSSVTTGQSAVKLETKYLTKLEWWEDEAFSDRAKLEAAELVASKELKPALVSRGSPRRLSISMSKNGDFYDSIKTLLKGPSGMFELLGVDERIQNLEQRIENLEKQQSLRFKQNK